MGEIIKVHGKYQKQRAQGCWVSKKGSSQDTGNHCCSLLLKVNSGVQAIFDFHN